jgi:hypothetical protein
MVDLRAKTETGAQEWPTSVNHWRQHVNLRMGMLLNHLFILACMCNRPFW